MSSGPAHRVQSAVVEYGFPQGHLGHLSEEEEAAFKNFKLYCAEHGYYTPAGEDNQKASHDDPLMLRFLRARRFIVPDAFKQFQDTEDWRRANQLDQLYETIDLEHYEETRRLYPQWTGRRDRRGIPVYVFEVKHLNAKTMSAYEKSAKSTRSKAQTDGTVSAKLIRLFALYENLTRFVMPLCTALTDREHPRTPITQSNNIVDISGVGLKQFWNLRGHMQDASTLATAHYPETLDRIFIIGAPAFFPTVWGWIKKWFDPITTSKIFILSHAEVKKTLEAFIDPANIPKKYGGQLEFEFGDFPVLDPAIQKAVEWEGTFQNFPHGPLYWTDQTPDMQWEDGKGGEKIKAIAVGSVGEKQRDEQVCTVTRLLDPLVEESASARIEGGLRAAMPELLSVPTAMNSVNDVSVGDRQETQPAMEGASTNTGSSGVKLEINGEKPVAVPEEELVPASKSNPVTVVTAEEGIQNLSLNGNAGNVVTNSVEPHQPSAANSSDPHPEPAISGVVEGQAVVNGNINSSGAGAHAEQGILTEKTSQLVEAAQAKV